MTSFLKFLFIFTITLFMTSCGDETKRTEAEYINIATEAHSTGKSKLAILALSKAIQAFPKNADLQLLRGKIFLDLEDGAAAEIAFNKAISLGYNRDFIKYDLAESWLYQKKPGKVIDTLEPEITQGTKDPLIYEIVGRAYIATRNRTNSTLFIENMNKARAYIEEAYRLNPNNTQVLIAKAWLPAMMGNLDEALDWLHKADLIVKDQRQNLAIQGELLIRQDKIDAAQEIYTRLVKKFPQYPQYKLELGYTYLLKNDYAKSREWVEPIAKQYPNQLRATYLLSNISLMEKKYEEAKRLSDIVLAKIPDDLKTIIVNGASSYFLGDFENAHQKLSLFYSRTGSIPALKLLAATKIKLGDNIAVEKLLAEAGQEEKNQTDMELLNLVAIASAKVGKSDVALAAYQKLAAQSPDTASFKSNTGLLQIEQGNYEEGFKNLENGLKQGKVEAKSYLATLATRAMQVRQYDRAKIYIENYKKESKDSYKPWLLSAVLQSQLKNNDAVRQDFNTAIEKAPDVGDIKARYAIFEKMNGNTDKAIVLAQEALKLEPTDIGAGKLLLEELIKKKDLSGIESIIDRAMKTKNISDISKLVFADYYTLLGQPQKTLNIIETLPEILKATSAYKIIASKAYLRHGQGQQAIDLLEKFSLNNPQNMQALKYLLQGYILTKDQEKYISTLEKMNKISPDDTENKLRMVTSYISTEKYDQAEKMLNLIEAKNDQQSLQKKILRAMLETNRQNVKKAISILAPLNKEHPNNGGISMLYARNLANIGRVSDAIKVSKSWADDHPENTDAKQFLADLYLGNKDIEKAKALYESILSSQNKIAPQVELHAHNNLAMIYIEKDHAKKALEHAQKAADIAPNNPAVMDTFAQALLKAGQTTKAIDRFDQALALLPTDDRENRSLFTLGKARALIQDGQKKQAAKILNRLLKDDPDFTQIKGAKQLLSDLE